MCFSISSSSCSPTTRHLSPGFPAREDQQPTLELESPGKVSCSFCLASDHAFPLFAHGVSHPGVGAKPHCPGWRGEADRCLVQGWVHSGTGSDAS